MFPNWDAYRNHYGIRGFIVVVDMADMAAFPGCERLDIGERQAIQLAWQKDLPLLIEEEQGRQVAQALGLWQKAIRWADGSAVAINVPKAGGVAALVW